MVSIVASLVTNGVWVLHLRFEFGMFLEEATFVSLSIRPSLKALPKTVLTRELVIRLVSTSPNKVRSSTRFQFAVSFKNKVTVLELESGLPPLNLNRD